MYQTEKKPRIAIKEVIAWSSQWRRVRMRVVSLLVVVLLLLLFAPPGNGDERSLKFTRDDFPEDFIFGAGTSAYQVEGAAAEDGRTPSVWDTYSHAGYSDGNGDVASDEYHKYKEDVKLMMETGLEGYRFSISWSRLIPNGRGSINAKGLEYYNNLINELLKNGIEPHVTLFHYDLPQALEDEYGGWLSPRIVDDFTAYAEVCFKEFGDRVSHWTTFNEVNVFVLGGYDVAFTPPRRCSYPFGNCSAGDSTKEPYIAAHYCLLAHSSAASIYNIKYKDKQKGLVGINIFIYNFLPLTNSTEDIRAAKRAQDFYTGWFLEPLFYGDYPETMKEAAGPKMLKFTESQSKDLMSSFDFIGINYYANFYVEDDPNDEPTSQRDIVKDMCAKLIPGKGDGKTEDVYSPKGLQSVLEYLKQSYGNPPIYIHENGYPTPQTGSLNDTDRVNYLSGHLQSLLDSLRNGSNTKGYFVWSFIDVFELLVGYDLSYGLYYVDFEDKDRKRYPRLSAYWYSHLLKQKWQIDSKNIALLDPSIPFSRMYAHASSISSII